MNWKKAALVFITILLAICLFAPAAHAKKKKSSSKKSSGASIQGISGKTFQVGGIVGANVLGYLPYGTVTVTSGGNEEKASMSGSGGFGPYFGAYGHLFFSGWIVRGEFGYGYQGGVATFKYDNKDIKDQDIDFAMNNVRLGVGIGRTLMRHPIVHPYFVICLDYDYLTFKEKDENESASGSGAGAAGMIGLDVKFLKNFFAGAAARLDLIYSLNPLILSKGGTDTEINLGYLPVSFLLTGGYLF